MQKDMVLIPKTEYRELLKLKRKFGVPRKRQWVPVRKSAVRHETWQEPSTKVTASILKEMKATGLYKPAFLRSLAAGLKDSAYFKS